MIGLGGEQLTELQANNNWSHTNVFGAGGLLATYSGSDTIYALTDWQGTKRGETSAGGCLGSWSSLPFGNDLTQAGNCVDASEHHYTGKVRDSETGYASGNDDFGARYYASSIGHWLSPDWAASAEAVPYASYGSPQTLNLYAFVGNNPLSDADPDGHSSYGEQMMCSNGPSGGQCGVGTDPFASGIYTAGGMTSISPVDGQNNKQEDMYTAWQESIEIAQWEAEDASVVEQQLAGGGTVPVVVGQRPIQNKWAQFISELFTFHKAYHSYYRLTGDDGTTHQFEVLGDPGSSHNQQVRDTYGTSRASAGREHTVYATEAQASALINRSEYFESHPCPVCTGGQEGYNLVFHNSNSFVYNMLSGAPGGGIPPPSAPTITPGYAKRTDDWY